MLRRATSTFAAVRWHGWASVQLRHASSRTAGPSLPPVTALLGLEPSAPQDVLRKAYLEKVKELHPDNHGGGSADRFIQLQQAWEKHEGAAAGAGALPTSYEEVVTFEVGVDEELMRSQSADCIWTAQRMEAIRCAVVGAAQSAARELGGEGLAPPMLRRCAACGEEGETLSIHLAAQDPWHRNRLAATLGTKNGNVFLEHLRQRFNAAGGRNLTLQLKGQVRWHTSGGGAQQRLRVHG